MSRPQITSLLGCIGVRDENSCHIEKGKQGSSKHNKFTTPNLLADYPVDVCAGTQLMFFYKDIVHY